MSKNVYVVCMDGMIILNSITGCDFIFILVQINFYLCDLKKKKKETPTYAETIQTPTKLQPIQNTSCPKKSYNFNLVLLLSVMFDANLLYHFIVIKWRGTYMCPSLIYLAFYDWKVLNLLQTF